MAVTAVGQSELIAMAPGVRDKLFSVPAAMFAALLVFTTSAVAQSQVAIEVSPQSRAVRIEMSREPEKRWSFLDVYAGVAGLGRRIRSFQALDASGAAVTVRELAPGQFQSTAPASRLSYEVNLSPPTRASDAAFVSWLTNERGLLRLSDLLPLTTQLPGSSVSPLLVTVNAAGDWASHANEEVTATRAYRFEGTNDAVILVGKNVRRSVRTSSGNLFKVLVDGTWAFSDQDAMDTLLKVIQVHSELGPLPCNQVTLVLSTFPAGAVTANTWSAETRGCAVVVLLGQTPSRIGALAQLGNALTHEAFHLWIPNGVALRGDYDWFYEGFTMYQAARAAVRLGLVTWPEFLNAIARAYDGSSATANAESLSLIDASKQRWTVGSSTVYSKAMVVAFIYDLNLRNQTGGKRSLDDVYRRLFREHPRRSAVKQLEADGNAATTAALQSELASRNFVERFITARGSVDLKKELAPFGLSVEKLVRTHISVSEDLLKRQRDLLKQLGYNEPRARKR